MPITFGLMKLSVDAISSGENEQSGRDTIELEFSPSEVQSLSASNPQEALAGTTVEAIQTYSKRVRRCTGAARWRGLLDR